MLSIVRVRFDTDMIFSSNCHRSSNIDRDNAFRLAF